MKKWVGKEEAETMDSLGGLPCDSLSRIADKSHDWSITSEWCKTTWSKDKDLCAERIINEF